MGKSSTFVVIKKEVLLKMKKMMKKNFIYALMLICTAGILASCSKNDDKKQSELVGKWKLNPEMPIDMVWEAAPGDDVISMGETKLPLKSLLPIMQPKLKGIMLQSLKDVTLTADGKVEATYKGKASTDWTLATDYATYKDVGNNTLMLHFNADKVLAGMEGLDAEQLAKMKLFLLAGIPVHYTITGSSARFYLDTEMMKALRNVFPSLLMSVDGIPDFVKPLLKTTLPGLMEKSTKLELGLHMMQVPN